MYSNDRQRIWSIRDIGLTNTYNIALLNTNLLMVMYGVVTGALLVNFYCRNRARLLVLLFLVFIIILMQREKAQPVAPKSTWGER